MHKLDSGQPYILSLLEKKYFRLLNKDSILVHDNKTIKQKLTPMSKRTVPVLFGKNITATVITRMVD